MTRVVVYRREGGRLAGFEAKGHAGAPRRGEYDMVCSAVSALTQTAVNAIEAVAGVPTNPTIKEGLLRMVLPEELSVEQERDCDIILRTIIQGLTDIAHEHPAYVQVAFEDWRKAT